MEPKRYCLSCKFFEGDKDDSGEGSCHRFPPSTPDFIKRGQLPTGEIFFQSDLSAAKFPRVFNESWCGEHQLLHDIKNNLIPRSKLNVRLRKRIPDDLETLGELLLFGRHSIVEMKNIGPESMPDIDEIMKEAGLFDEWILT